MLFLDSTGREIATEGGSIQEFKIHNITNINDDPIFSVPGDLAINWKYSNNRVRIALTGGHLSGPNDDDDNTHGLGSHLNIDWLSYKQRYDYKIKISNIQNCSRCRPATVIKLQGKDHSSTLKSGPVYGSYAIYLANNTKKFPTDQKLTLQVKRNNL